MASYGARIGVIAASGRAANNDADRFILVERFLRGSCSKPRACAKSDAEHDGPPTTSMCHTVSFKPMKKTILRCFLKLGIFRSGQSIGQLIAKLPAKFAYLAR